MFDVGFWELLLIFGLGLVVLGPERLPRVAMKVGRWAGQARSMARHLSNQIRTEIEPVEKSIHSMQEGMRQDFSARRPEPGQSTPAADTSMPSTETPATAVTPDADSSGNPAK